MGEVVEEKTEKVVSTNGTEAKNGEAEAKKDVAETKEVVEKETEEVVSTNGTEAKEDVVEAKNGEAEAKKDEDKNGHENDKEETHKDADMPMPSENGDEKTETTETPTETTKTTKTTKTTEEDKETATKRKASESEVEALPVSA